MYANSILEQNVTQAHLPEEETDGTAADCTENLGEEESFNQSTLGTFPSARFMVSVSA